ncbi:DUF1579 family protein [Rhodanobacter sp. Si-c]|uniref:DUF1579 family protein n=1 Tax=Rhodanobacter lycopersici TaxID=3162487 RepID=A0ABV3QAI7_9GAMM
MPLRRLSSCLPIAVALMAAACVAPSASAADATPTTSTSAPAHRLDWLAGRWSVRQSFWADSAKAPTIDSGSAVFTAVLGGQHLRQELQIDSVKPFRGLGYFGYDAAAGRYDSLWMDVNFGGVVVAHGDCEANGRVCSFRGAMSGQRGATVPVREVMEITDADHFSYAYYERHDGREALTVKLEYTRLK